MRDIPDDEAVTAPDEARSGAFVLRAWSTDGSVRARVRSTLDVADPDDTEVVDLLGSTATVVAEAVSRLQRWLDEFISDAPVTRS